MPLGSKTVTELWTPVKNKKTGEVYTGLEQCASLERLEQEDKELSDLLDKELNAWLDKDTANETALQDFSKGFRYKHANGYSYKIIQFKNGDYQLSRSKGGGAGGYKKGYGGQGYTHFRTVSAKIVRPELIPGFIDSQEANDNFELVQLQPDKQGDRFLLLNKKPYTPTLDGATSGSSEKTETTKENTEAETEQTESIE